MARKRETIVTDSPNPKPDRRSRKRIAVYMNDDGTPDWDAVPEEDRARLGMGGAKEAEPDSTIDPSTVAFLMHTLTVIEAAVVAPRIGITREQAMRALTPAPEVGKGISEAGARVLNKYGGTLGRYSDEIVLLALIGTWQTSAFAAMRAAVESKPAPEPPPPPLDKHETVEPKPEPQPLPDDLLV